MIATPDDSLQRTFASRALILPWINSRRLPYAAKFKRWASALNDILGT